MRHTVASLGEVLVKFKLGMQDFKIERGYKVKYKYEIGPVEFGDTDWYAPRWASQELHSVGNTLQELLDNATYYHIDQDGGELGDSEADDDKAQDYITSWWRDNGEEVA